MAAADSFAAAALAPSASAALAAAQRAAARRALLAGACARCALAAAGGGAAACCAAGAPARRALLEVLGAGGGEAQQQQQRQQPAQEVQQQQRGEEQHAQGQPPPPQQQQQVEQQQQLAQEQGVCVGCLGVLEALEEGAAARLAAAVAVRGHDFGADGFALEVALPASLLVRAAALRAHAARGAAVPLPPAPGAKELLKRGLAPLLARCLGAKHCASSGLRVKIDAVHDAAAAECEVLARRGGAKPPRRGRKRPWQRRDDRAARQGEDGDGDVWMVNASAVQRALAQMNNEQLREAVPCPMPVSQQRAVLKATVCRDGVFVGGRYLKLARGIPQSPWLVATNPAAGGGAEAPNRCDPAGSDAVLVAPGDESHGGPDDDMATVPSLADRVGSALAPLFGATSWRFQAAGREDADVRMRGSGRPFILELADAKCTTATPAALAAAAAAAGVGADRGGVCAALNLRVVGAEALPKLREGETDKRKVYTAVVWLSEALDAGGAARLASLRDIEVAQATPIRVLHRRSPLTRPKLIHSLVARPPTGGEWRPGERHRYVELTIEAQAGTYIKEFVHGDHGRTSPSLGDLLGGCEADILQLDVARVVLDLFSDSP